MIVVDNNNKELSRSELFLNIMHESRIYNETAVLNIEKEKMEMEKNSVHSCLTSSHNNLSSIFYKLEEETLQHRLYLCDTKLALSKLYLKRCETIIKLFSSSLVDPIVKEDLYVDLVQEAYLKNQYLLNTERAKSHINNRCKEFLDILCKDGFTSKSTNLEIENVNSNKSLTNEEIQLQNLAFETKQKFLEGKHPIDVLVNEFKLEVMKMKLDDKQKRECDIFVSLLTGTMKDFGEQIEENKNHINLPIKLLDRDEKIMNSDRIEIYKKMSEELKTFVSQIGPSILELDIVKLDTLLNPDGLTVLENLTIMKRKNTFMVQQEETMSTSIK